MSAFERVGEFGTMMALGNRGGQVFRFLVVENLLLGISGGLVGVAIGIFLAFSVSAIGIFMPPPPTANIGYTAYIRVVLGVILIAFFVGVGGVPPSGVRAEGVAFAVGALQGTHGGRNREVIGELR